MGMALVLLSLVVGFMLGRFSVRGYQRDRIAWAQRRLQLQVLSLSKSRACAARWCPPTGGACHQPNVAWCASGLR